MVKNLPINIKNQENYIHELKQFFEAKAGQV